MTARKLTVSGIMALLLAFVPGSHCGWAMPQPSAAEAGRTCPSVHAGIACDTVPPDSIAPRDKGAVERQPVFAQDLADSLQAGEGYTAVPVDSVALRHDLSKHVRPKFVPDPQRALWLSLVLPGAGQIYNRKYWKIPIVYGGFLGCTYAFMWNQQMYRDYSQAYLDIMDDDPRTQSYMEMLPPRYDITGREDYFKDIFKNKKNRYRRYRDLSVFCFIGVYLLSVIDAYVDAHLSEFDISPELGMSVGPTVIGGGSYRNGQAVGLGCSLSF